MSIFEALLENEIKIQINFKPNFTCRKYLLKKKMQLIWKKMLFEKFKKSKKFFSHF